MCPVYEESCPRCKDTQGNPKIHYFHRSMSRAAAKERCPDCGAETQRVYSCSLKKEFFGFFDEQYQTQITSRKQEQRLMKQHGHVDFRETDAYDKPRWKSHRKIARRKPFFSIAGVKPTKMERD